MVWAEAWFTDNSLLSADTVIFQSRQGTRSRGQEQCSPGPRLTKGETEATKEVKRHSETPNHPGGHRSATQAGDHAATQRASRERALPAGARRARGKRAAAAPPHPAPALSLPLSILPDGAAATDKPCSSSPTPRPRYPGLISAKAAVSPRACARPTKRPLPGAKAAAFRVCACPEDGLPSSGGGRERSVGARSALAQCSVRAVSLRPKSSGAGYRDKSEALGVHRPRKALRSSWSALSLTSHLTLSVSDGYLRTGHLLPVRLRVQPRGPTN